MKRTCWATLHHRKLVSTRQPPASTATLTATNTYRAGAHSLSRSVYQSQSNRPSFRDGNFLSQVANTLLVFQESNLGIQASANRSDGLQKILVDLGLQHIDFMERCLHLRQTFGARAPFTCRQRWQNRGDETAVKVPRSAPGSPNRATSPGRPASQWCVATPSQTVTAGTRTKGGHERMAACRSQSGPRTAVK